jgi:rod shape-determining protein MreC
MPRNSHAYRITALTALLALSFALVTVYFREGDNGGLHGTQRWLGDVFAPASGVVQRLAQPFRDAGGWAEDVQRARKERDRLEQENARLRKQLADVQTDGQLSAELQAELGYVRSDAFPALGSYTPRSALVIVRSPALFSQKVLLDQGTGAGIQVGDPVVSGVATKDYQGAALVGRVTAVSHDTADVTLISDPAMAVSASVAGQQGADGVLQPNAGDASTQVLDFVGKQYTVQPGNLVVTSGFSDSKLGLASFFPRGIMIGVVSTVSQSDTETYKSIQVTPWVDLRSFRTALVLTQGGR